MKNFFTLKSFWCLILAVITLPLSGQNNPLNCPTIAGQVKYMNSSATQLYPVEVQLKSIDGQVLQNTVTDYYGNFSFCLNSNGVYIIDVVSSIAAGGITSIDALLALKHYVALSVLSGLKYEAGDINRDGYINATHSLFILKRSVDLINTFPAGNWVFERDTLEIDNNTTDSVLIYGLCYGDIDASYIPPICSPPTTIASAGADQWDLICSTTQLSANVPQQGESGTWEKVSGNGGSFSDIHDPSAKFTGVLGVTYVLKWTIVGVCTPTWDWVNISFKSPGPCQGMESFTYGGQTYNTIQIGIQCWMKENLNIGTMVNDQGSWGWEQVGCGDNGIIEKFCPGNDSALCAVYGGLYDWNEMMQYSIIPGSKGICPVGWHIPDEDDWCTLVSCLDPTANCTALGFSGYTAGGKMKEAGTTHWGEPNAGATNESGFTGLPAGYRAYTGGFEPLGNYGMFWSSDDNYETGAVCWALDRAIQYMERDYRHKLEGLSVRCIKDTCSPPTSQANAGPDQLDLPCPVAQLSANAPVPGETGTWTIASGDGGLINDVNNPAATLRGTFGASYILKWTITGQCHPTQDEVVISFKAPAPCPGMPAITYGNKVYHTVQICDQCWLKENLDIGTFINSVEYQTDNALIEKYCYNNDTNNCNIYGALYQWNEMMQYVTTQGAQGICPGGFHIPSRYEWDRLENNLGGVLVAGGKIKEAGFGHWSSPNTGANNETGFTALGAGYRLHNGEFSNLMLNGYFWTSSMDSYSDAWIRYASFDLAQFSFHNRGINDGYSVRCIKDSCNLPFQQSDAGPNQSIINDTAVLQGNIPQNGTGNWEIISGSGGTLADVHDPATVFSGVINSSYSLTWTLGTGCATSTDTVIITFYTDGMNLPCPDIPNFSYGGQTYNTVKIGAQCWMKENLNVGVFVPSTITPYDHSNLANNGIIEKYCYNNDTSMCSLYGGLYDWDEMMQYTSSPGSRGICPSGWHVPTDEDWCVLSTYLDATVNCNGPWPFLGYGAGRKMKDSSTVYWISNNWATNESGFSALGAGHRFFDGNFTQINTATYFWSSSLHIQKYGVSPYMDAYNNGIYRYYSYKNRGFSVRCLKD